MLEKWGVLILVCESCRLASTVLMFKIWWLLKSTFMLHSSYLLLHFFIQHFLWLPKNTKRFVLVCGCTWRLLLIFSSGYLWYKYTCYQYLTAHLLQERANDKRMKNFPLSYWQASEWMQGSCMFHFWLFFITSLQIGLL